MRPEVKAQWLADLRSGEYAQGSGRLCVLPTDDTDDSGESTPVKHCCLGVLADQAVKAGVGTWQDIDGTRYYCPPGYDANNVYPYPHQKRESHYLPLSVVEWAGIPREGGVHAYGIGHYPDGYDGTEKRRNLSEANDEGATFAEIASLIEEHF